VIHPLQFPRTRARLEAEGLRVEPIDTTELAKAEAGVTCCSLIVRVGRR
jgi:N-dimethylarginine dimethylaminohydrolase